MLSALKKCEPGKPGLNTKCGGSSSLLLQQAMMLVRQRLLLSLNLLGIVILNMFTSRIHLASTVLKCYSRRQKLESERSYISNDASRALPQVSV